MSSSRSRRLLDADAIGMEDPRSRSTSRSRRVAAPEGMSRTSKSRKTSITESSPSRSKRSSGLSEYIPPSSR